MNSHAPASLKLGLSVLITVLVGAALIALPVFVARAHKQKQPFRLSKTSGPATNEPDRKLRALHAEAYGKLPLSFEANHGQTDSQVSFLSRGAGYALFLTHDGAVLSLGHTADKDRIGSHRQGGGRLRNEEQPNAKSRCDSRRAVLSMKLKDAERSPRIIGIDQLPGKVNYLIGQSASEWRREVPTYARVRYENIYPNIDLVYYGNQQQLEYDFEIQPGANPGAIKLGFQGGKGRIDRIGNLKLATTAGMVTFLKPVAYQIIDGERRAVNSGYVASAKNEMGFRVGDYDRTQPLIIDPVLSYSTYLGGADQETPFAIAVDSTGSAYITGETFSTDFPVAGSIQPNGGNLDAFVTKLNPAGSAIVYSTFLGGSLSDAGYGIAVNSSGNAFVTGATVSNNFPLSNAVHATFGGVTDAFVCELNSAGSGFIYSTYLGGSSVDLAYAIAVDHSNNAFVTGSAQSRDFPLTNPIQSSKAGNSIFKSSNSATNWSASDSGLTAGSVTGLAFDPTDSAALYAAADNGVFKSTNSGASWAAISTPQTVTALNGIAIDPANAAIIYAASNNGVFKSTDGGSHFVASNTGLNSILTRLIVVDPLNSNNLYISGLGNRVSRSTNGGGNWGTFTIGGASLIYSLAINPITPATLYAGTNRGVFKSTNGGGSWVASNTGIQFVTIRSVAIDRNNTSTMYAAGSSGLFKSTDAGATWTNTSLGFVYLSVLTIDPTNTSILYASSPFGTVVFKSTDGGGTWSSNNTGYSGVTLNCMVVDPTSSSNLFLGTASGAEAFITKISSGGTSQIYSSYLGGSAIDVGNGIAVDGAGSAYITGYTTSLNYPTLNPVQSANGGLEDVFLTKINELGSSLVYSTYLGGGGNERGWGIAVDSDGNTYVAGQTDSTNYPTLNAFQGALGGFLLDAFVTKMNSSGTGLVYSTYLGGNDYDQGFGIAVTQSGNAVVTGATYSTNFPRVNQLGNFTPNGAGDGFVTRLNATGGTLEYSTYLGGSAYDAAWAIAVDSSGNAYVTGETDSFDFPTAGPLQSSNHGGTDLFVSKIQPAPDLSLTITDAPDPSALGNNFTYTISVANGQEAAATNASVSDVLPSGTSFVSATASQGSCSGTTTVTCDLGNIAPGGTATVTIVVTPQSAGTVNNTATVSSQEADSNPANNSASTSTTVTAFVSVSGRVTQFDTTGFAAVTVSLNRSQTSTVLTDEDGKYSFSNLPAGGNYTVTPTKANYSFNPPSQTFNNLTQHQIANFSSLCSYTITPLNQSFGAAGGTGSVTLTENGGCNWTAVSNASWITITSGANGSTSGTVSFTVAATTSSRRGTVTIAGQTFTVWQGFDSCTACDFVVARTFSAPGAFGPQAVADFNNDGKLDFAYLDGTPQAGVLSLVLGDGKGGFGLPVIIGKVQLDRGGAITAGDFDNDGKVDLAVALRNSQNLVNVYRNTSNGTFAAPASYPTGTDPNYIAVGELNGDGKLDLITTNEQSHNLSLLFNNGMGSFGPTVNIGSLGEISYPVFVAIGDLNGDSKPDLSVASISAVANFFGNGSGGFTYANSLFLGAASAKSLAVADLNGDGKSDLVIGNDGISIAFNNGAGTFGVPQILSPVSNRFGYVRTADFNGDGKIDIVAGSNSTFVISVFLNNGAGSFSSAGYYHSTSVGFLDVADFDGDTKLDVFTASTSLLRGLGNGKLEAAPAFATGNLPKSLVAGDFNQDGKPDVAAATESSNGAVSIHLADGNGGFLLPTNFSIGAKPLALVVSDFNGDGKQDLATANYEAGKVSILIGNGSGGFGASTNIVVGSNPRSLVAADFNNDGKIDLAVNDQISGPYSHISLLTGNGNGGFAPTPGISLTAGSTYTISSGDFNLDGRVDLISVGNLSNGAGVVSVFKGDGFGGFGPQVDFSNPAIGGVSYLGNFNLVVEDFNGDSKLDVAVLNTANNKIGVLLGNGKAGFSSAQSYTVGTEPRNLAVADFNSDGKPDLAVANWFSNNVSVLSNDGSGNFTGPFAFEIGLYSSALTAGDFNADGKADIVAASYGNNNLVLLTNRCTGIATGTRVSISGHIVDDYNGTGFGGVGVVLTSSQLYSMTTATDLNGNYDFNNLPANDTYVVKPATRFFAFTPSQRQFANPSGNQTADFTGTRLTYSISGRVVDMNNNGVGGVTLGLGFGQPSAMTASDGSYTITNVPSGINYYLNPSKEGYTFDPVSTSFFPLDGNVTANFTVVTSSQIKFPDFQTVVSEGAGSAVINVTRVGDPATPATVDFATSDSSGLQKRDYTLAAGTLNFAAGETTKTFRVLVTDNAYVDGSRNVFLSLSNPSGATLGGPNFAILTINDNDSTQPTSNPADDAGFFVRQHYYDFLSRLPDSGGLDYWTGQITQCGSDQSCIRSKRIDVSNAFFYELEYQQTGSYVYRLYRAAFGNNQPFPNPNSNAQYPNEEKKLPSYAAFAPDRARVRGGASLAQTQLALANAFVQRAAFVLKYPASLSGPNFVDAVLATLRDEVGADLTLQRQSLIDLFNQEGRAAVIYRLADDNIQSNPINNRAFIDAEYNRAFVVTQYFGYLRRNPDIAGFIFWLGQVNGAPLRDVVKQHAMVCSFITSAEYQQRFSSVVTHNNTECQ